MYVFKSECIQKNNLTLMCESPWHLENSTYKNKFIHISIKTSITHGSTSLDTGTLIFM